jgi:hypothetical protein
MTSLAKEILTRQRKALKKLIIPNPALVNLFKGRKYVLPAGDFGTYQKAIRPRLAEGKDVALNGGEHLVRATGRVRLRGAARGLGNSLVVASGDFAAPGHGWRLDRRVRLECSVVFAGGDVEVNEVGDTVIICSGEARLTGEVHTSVVIAQGPVRVSADGSATLSNVNVILAGGKIEKPPGKVATPDALVKGGVAKPLGFVRFFETARVGVEVGKAKKHPEGARVTKLDAAKGFARAGLWKDDVVTAVDGQEVKTPEAFRRALLRRLVEGGEAKLRVFRDGEWMTVFVTPRL